MAQARTLLKTLATGRSTGTDAAQALTFGVGMNTTPAIETAVALSLALTKALATGRADETATAVPRNFPLFTTPAEDTSTAYALTLTSVPTAPFWETFQSGFTTLLESLQEVES